MEIAKGITVCHDCKTVFNGIAGDLKCLECGSDRLLLMANSAVYDAVITDTKTDDSNGCPNLIAGVCELTGNDVWEDE